MLNYKEKILELLSCYDKRVINLELKFKEDIDKLETIKYLFYDNIASSKSLII